MTTLSAITASSFVNSIGVNTHIDFYAYGYENLGVVESAINYLGIKNLRDSSANGSDGWIQVAQATGAKFDDYIAETSPDGMQSQLQFFHQFAQAGILNYVEGGNEEDDAYPASLGNNIWITAQFQQQVYALGQQYGVPVINMSFGAGWTAANNWHGNYDKVGDLSAYTDYANAHTYPMPGQTTEATIQQINGDARLAASARPIITSEMGWDGNMFSQGAVAQYVVQATLDGIKNGDVKTYFYALFNDGSGNFGLMNSDGSAMPAGNALHNLTSLLADNGGNFSPGSLSFNLSGADGNENTLLMQKSDGSQWLALWDERSGPHTVTVNLDATASQIQVFDPVTGTWAIAGANNSNSITVNLGNDPLLIEIDPAGGTVPTSGGSTAGASDPAPSDPPPRPPSAPTGSTTSSGSGSGISVSAPASIQDTSGASVAVPGVQITDDYASRNPATVTARITDQNGTLSTVDAWGNWQQGFGAGGLTLSGTIWQVNAGLSNLQYAGSGSDSIAIQVSDSVGAQAAVAVSVNGGAGTPVSAPTASAPDPTPSPSQADQQIAAGDSQPVITASNTSIGASAGDHMIFIEGTGDTLIAVGGTETVHAYQGGNSITTGAGNDRILYGGSGNRIDAGGGNNRLDDSGSNSTIVLPGAGQGNDDIYGWVMQNGDTFDLRSLLAQTSWNGNAGSIGDFVHVNMAGVDATISVDPSGAPGGASYDVATLRDSGTMDLSALLAHSIT
jgi:serralysin